MLDTGVLPPIVVLVVVVVLLGSSLRIVKEHERMVIFRLGRLKGIADPGIVSLAPFIDKSEVVDLTQTMPGWQGMSRRELHEKILSRMS